MTRLNRTAIAGALGGVLLALPCHAQTYKEATTAQVAPPPLAVSKDTAIRPFKFHASDEALVDLCRRSGRERRPLCGVGAAVAVCERAARGVQITALGKSVPPRTARGKL
jgi:hypothetical protein